MKTFKKVAVIGLDCAITHLIDKHIAEGVLPNFKKLFTQGTVCDNALVPFPTITPPNWATICTGAWPQTHGVTDFWVPTPGATPTYDNAVCAFNTKWYTAETIWEAGERAGKKSIVFNFPGSWPAKAKNSIVVGGRGLAVGLVYDGHTALEKHIVLCGDMLFTTSKLWNAVPVTFHTARGWQNVDALGDDPLEAEVQPNFPMSVNTFDPVTWYILVRESGTDGYDTVTLSPTKNMADAFFTIKTGQWSHKIFTTLQPDGKNQRAFFNAKLVRLSDDAEDFSLYLNPIVSADGWSYPTEIDEEICDLGIDAVPGNSGGYQALSIGWIDDATWVEINNQHADYNAAVATKLLKNHEWDIFFMHHHPPDWAYHLFITDMDKETAASDQAYERAWNLHREIYKAADRMLGRIMEELGDDTCIVLVSDHGATMDGPEISAGDILEQAGLMAFAGGTELNLEGETKTGALVKKMNKMPDISKSVALPQRICHIYVNLKGRYADGIVEPKDFAKVQQQIIDALYEYRYPESGERPVALALTNEDARIIGLSGERSGDVVYAFKPEFGSQHGNMLPTAKWGEVGSLHALLTFYGPGIKAQRLERTCNIVDLVPTLCYGANLPVPKQCEGSVIYQLFEDIDFKSR